MSERIIKYYVSNRYHNIDAPVWNLKLQVFGCFLLQLIKLENSVSVVDKLKKLHGIEKDPAPRKQFIGT